MRKIQSYYASSKFKEPNASEYNKNINVFKNLLIKKALPVHLQNKFIKSWKIIHEMKSFNSLQAYLSSKHSTNAFYTNINQTLLISDHLADYVKLWKKTGKNVPKTKIMDPLQINSIKWFRLQVSNYLLKLPEHRFLKWIQEQSKSKRFFKSTFSANQLKSIQHSYYDHHAPSVKLMNNAAFDQWKISKRNILSNNRLQLEEDQRMGYIMAKNVQKNRMRNVNTFYNYIKNFSAEDYHFNGKTHFISVRVKNNLNTWKQVKNQTNSDLEYLKIVPFQKISDMRKANLSEYEYE